MIRLVCGGVTVGYRDNSDAVKHHNCQLGKKHPIFYGVRIKYCHKCYLRVFEDNRPRRKRSPPSSPVSSPR